jgi:hypothetical protein
MERISSNSTLFFKIFFPSFWVVFFGAFTIAILFNPIPLFMGWTQLTTRIIFVVLYLIGVVVIYFTIFQLKRVELSTRQLYLTNYVKHYRYALEDIEQIQVHNYYLFSIGTLRLKSRGAFGREVRFMADRYRIKNFLASYPSVASLLQVEGI